eukprot:1488359-Rhodomonas_salina.4
MSGTDIGFSCAMSGTDIADAARTRERSDRGYHHLRAPDKPARYPPTPCPVLPQYSLSFRSSVLRIPFVVLEHGVEMAELAKKWLGKGVIGWDLAALEGPHPLEQHISGLKRALELGVPCTVHAGERYRAVACYAAFAMRCCPASGAQGRNPQRTPISSHSQVKPPFLQTPICCNPSSSYQALSAYARYAMSGTEVEYGATRALRHCAQHPAGRAGSIYLSSDARARY